MSLPTDSLNKCLAILGLAMISGSFYFWWPLKVESDNDYAEIVYFNEKVATSYSVMAEATNAAISMINSVQGDRSKLDDVQLKFIDRKLAEAKPASEKTQAALDEMLKPLRLAEVRYKRFVLASWIFGIASTIGLFLSCYGFYRWGISDRKENL